MVSSIQTTVNALVDNANTTPSAPTPPTEKFYVNGVETSPVSGVITLPSQSTYELSGTLNGKVVIGAPTEEALTEDTNVILNGVHIKANDETAFGLFYASKSQSMIVTLFKNKVNTIVCEKEQAVAEQQGACLYSNNNMILQGCGYLAVVNKGGHGIKASELRISSRPHVYAEASHDGVHGNSSLFIDGGYFCVGKANDGFGTGSTGSIKLFGGTFEVYNINTDQHVFDSKVAGYYFDNVRVITSHTSVFHGMTKCDPATFFGAGTVLDNGVSVEPEVVTIDNETYNKYTCTSASVSVTGYLPNSLILIKTIKTDVAISQAYITNKHEACIKYDGTSSKIAIKVAKETINYVRQYNSTEAYPAVQSLNNVEVEVKGTAIFNVSSVKGNGLEASTITFQDMKGVFSACGCGNHGIQGTEIIFGGSSSKSGNMPVLGVIECFDNGSTDIYARTSGSGGKATISIATPVDVMLGGVVACGTIGTALGSTNGSQITLGSSKRVYYNKVVSGSLSASDVETREPYKHVTNDIEL